VKLLYQSNLDKDGEKKYIPQGGEKLGRKRGEKKDFSFISSLLTEGKNRHENASTGGVGGGLGKHGLQIHLHLDKRRKKGD